MVFGAPWSLSAPALSSASGGRCGGGGGGGTMFATMGAVTTASTTMETPVTLASIAVALLGLLVALAIVDSTEVAIAMGVWMRTSMMTLPEETVSITACASTPARDAITLCISVCTFGVNEETSPASRRANSMTLIAGCEGGGGESGGGGEGGEGGGEGGGGDGGGVDGGGEGGGGGDGGVEGGDSVGGWGEGEGGGGEGEGGGGEGEGGGGDGGGGALGG